MNRKLLLVATLVVTTTYPLTAQHTIPGAKSNSSSQSASQTSYQQARRVLDDGIAAMGGLEALRAIKDFTLKEKGKVYALYQSQKPEPPFSVGNSEETLIVDLDRSYVFDELKTANGGFNTWVTTVIKKNDGQTFDMWSRTSTPIANASVNNFRPQMRRLPPFVLLEALDRAATLRYLGEDEIGGKRQKVISVLRPDNQQLSLSFDAETNLLTKYGYLYADAMVGDSEIAQTYSGYRTVGKLKLPASRVLYNSGEAVQEVEYTELTINTKPAETVFAGPNGFEKLSAPPATPAPAAVSKIANDVYILNGLAGGTHNVLFVAFNDYVLVIEAPEQIIFGNNSSQAIAKIKETVPGKPIKYLVLTHHHSDHAGGFREYVAEGATIVTTAGNKNFLERTASVDSSLLPKLAKRTPVIEVLENKKRVFQDTNHVVELYDIGPNPHSNEIIVAYLPKEKILFQADLLNPAANGSIPIAQDVTPSFSQRLDQMGLQVEKIYGVHGRPASPEELRTSVAKRKNSELKIMSGQ
jgi:glyoxylase-like metal-dependent hydrolase (beta-lactamase superfamily II)